MMFVGAIPRECVEQAFSLVDFNHVKAAYVCCSGSFRFEQAVNSQFPDCQVHSNDVSALSAALGRYATGSPLPIKYVGRLAFLEDALKEVGDTPLNRLGAMGVALQMCHFQLGERTLAEMTEDERKSSYMEAHFQHFAKNGGSFILGPAEKMAKYMSTLKVRSYLSGDFREHARAAIKAGGHIFAWPPTYKGGYEKIYRLIDECTEWEAPEYGVWGPESLPEWLNELKQAKANYVVCSDRDLRPDGHECQAMYQGSGGSKIVYLYSSEKGRSSFRQKRSDTNTEAFGYNLIEPAELTADSVVQVVQVDRPKMNFIRNKYLTTGLWFGNGIFNCLVFIDGRLAGGFIYDKPGQAVSKMKHPDVGHLKSIYLLCDFSTSRRGKLSKLIAMLASGKQNITPFDHKRVARTSALTTTVFSNNPKSMKYRGIYDFYSRRPAKISDPTKFVLTYVGKVRNGTNQQIYADWWKRWGRKAVRKEANAKRSND